MAATNTPDDQPTRPGLSDVIEHVIDAAQKPSLEVREVIDAVGDRSLAPVLLLPALAVATPLSGIPLMSSLAGIMIFLIAAQMLAMRNSLWLPDWVLRKHIKGSQVAKAFSRLKPAARWLDARTQQRFRLIARRPLVAVPQVICLVSGACMPILEFIPFSSSIAGIGVAFLALGMLARDGLVILLGLIPYALVAYLVGTALL